MLYKTIVLQLLEQCPETHDQLKSQRMLLPTLERCSTDLKARHEVWTDLLRQSRPGSDPSQIASEALEIALQELEDRLRSASSPDDNEPLSLDRAMTLFHTHTRPA